MTPKETFGEIAVNAAPPGAQLLGDVAATPGWGFDVVWTDDRNETHRPDPRPHVPDGRHGGANRAWRGQQRRPAVATR